MTESFFPQVNGVIDTVRHMVDRLRTHLVHPTDDFPSEAGAMRIPMTMLLTLAAYLVWASTFTGTAGAALPALGH